jgi:hypothetical protein
MIFTEFKYDQAWIDVDISAKKASIKANLGESTDLLSNGLKVIASRVKKDPMRYRDYGPYWWAIKALLRNISVSLGSNDDPILRDFYTGKTPLETLICAEKFRDDYLKTYFKYNNQFILNINSGDLIEIVDGDMESR